MVDAGNQLKGKLGYVAASGWPAVTLFRFRVRLSRSPEASSGFESLCAESSICRTDSRGRPRRTCGWTLVFIWGGAETELLTIHLVHVSLKWGWPLFGSITPGFEVQSLRSPIPAFRHHFSAWSLFPVVGPKGFSGWVAFSP